MRDPKRMKVLLAGVAVLFGCSGVVGCTSDVPEITESPAALDFDLGIYPDYAEKMKSCLAESGWDVTVKEDGGFSIEGLTESQSDLYSEDIAECEAELGFDADLPQLTEAQVREVYPHYVWAIQCLDENGYKPGDAISEQSYVDEYMNNGGLNSPYDLVAFENQDEAMWKTCPFP